MTVRAVASSTVKRRINAIDEWWQKNRQAAPDLFTEELAAALTLLSSVPHAGKIYPHAGNQDIRRLLLRSTRYVYYSHGSSRAFCLELCAWLRPRPEVEALSVPKSA